VRFTLGQLAEVAEAAVSGDPDRTIEGVGTLAAADTRQITFLANPQLRKYLGQTQAAAVIMTPADAEGFSGNALLSDQPHIAFARIAALYARTTPHTPGVHPQAVVHESTQVPASACIAAHAVVGPEVVLGEGVFIGPGCVVGAGSQIGDGSRLLANVTVLHDVEIGRRVLIQPGAVLGGDGFGFARDGEAWVRVPQVGRVVIGDDVEIGACTTVDRGAIEDTVIEAGAKLDNLIMIAHNVRIGANTAIAGCVGIAGSTTIGRNCLIAGGVGIVGHIEIPAGTTITAGSIVLKGIKAAGVYSSGTPLEETASWHRNYARAKQLDEMSRRLKALEKELAELKRGNH